MSSRSYAYKIYLANTRPLADPAEYTVILHKADGRTCKTFTTTKQVDVRASNPKIYKFEHKVEVVDRCSSKHDFCDSLDKELIGYLARDDMPTVKGTFWDTKPRESQFTVFRWLWELVDRKILNKAAVIRLEPRFETEDRDFGRGFLDKNQ
ncbi:hypothetical protein BDV18DRAFT_161704 [Aspergillus unguis]